MVDLIGNFSRLESKKVLVAGDLMLDTYTIGKAKRISPEAPVAVVEVQTSEERPGGAGNTLLNLVSMGAEVSIIGRVGQDAAGKRILKALQEEGVSLEGVVEEDGFCTPVKNRIIADHQQIVRVDHEIFKPLEEATLHKILKKIPSLLEGVQALALSDYGKGFLSEQLLQALIEEANKRGIFIIADPKGSDFTRYKNVTLIKPNLKEAYLAAHLAPSFPLSLAAKKILAETQSKYVMITRSEEGISLFENEKASIDFPVTAKQVKDVTGAGDTVLAMLTFSLANQLPLPVAIQFSNIAAGIAIEQFGCARITLSALAKRLLELDASNKIFDSDHLHVLKSALQGQTCSLAQLSGSHAPSSTLIQALMTHKKKTGHAIVASLNETPEASIISMLAALQPIDFILLQTPADKIRKFLPDLTVFLP